MRGQKLLDAMVATNLLVDELLAQDLAAVVAWSNVASTVTGGLINNFTLVQQAVNRLNADGATNLNAGLGAAVSILESSGSSGSVKVIVFLTDGKGDYITFAAGGQASVAADNGIIIYSIGLGADADASPLVDMANNTGGEYLFSPDSNMLSGLFAQILQTVQTNTLPHNVGVVQYVNTGIQIDCSSVSPVASSCNTTAIQWAGLDGGNGLRADETVCVTFDATVTAARGSGFQVLSNNTVVTFTPINVDDDVREVLIVDADGGVMIGDNTILIATDAPSTNPSGNGDLPSQGPTSQPSLRPTDGVGTPSAAPSDSKLPSVNPTLQPSSITVVPSKPPTGPTSSPSTAMTDAPSNQPTTMLPSNTPTKSQQPSDSPSDSTSLPPTDAPSFDLQENEPSASNVPSPDIFQALCTPLSDSSTDTTSCPVGEGKPVCTPYRSPDHCPAEDSFPLLIMQREKLVNENLADLENQGYWFQYLDDVGAGYAFSRSNGVPAPTVYFCVDNMFNLVPFFDTVDAPTTNFVIRASDLHSNLGTFVLPAGFGGVEMLREVPMDLNDVIAYLLALEIVPSRLVVEEFISGSSTTPTLPNEYKFHMFNGEVGSVNGFLNRGTECACYTEVDETFKRLDRYGCFEPSVPAGLNGDNDLCYDIDFVAGSRNPYQLKGLI